MIDRLKVFDCIDFEHERHRYTVDGIPGISVTSLIKLYQIPFDTEYWTTYKALEASGYTVRKSRDRKIKVNGSVLALDQCKPLLKKKVSSHSIAQEWKQIADEGKLRGTEAHEYIEDAWKELRWEDRIHQKFIDDHAHWIPVALERIVGDFDYQVYGTFDGLFLDGTEYILQDNKTDKKISDSNPYQKLLHPLDLFDDCSLNKYRVQLNIYRHCIEKYTDIRISRMVITHFDREGEDYKMIEIKPLEVDYLLKHYDYNKKRIKHIS